VPARWFLVHIIYIHYGPNLSWKFHSNGMISAEDIQLTMLRAKGRRRDASDLCVINWYLRSGAIYWNFWYVPLKNNLQSTLCTQKVQGLLLSSLLQRSLLYFLICLLSSGIWTCLLTGKPISFIHGWTVRTETSFLNRFFTLHSISTAFFKRACRLDLKIERSSCRLLIFFCRNFLFSLVIHSHEIFL